MIMSNFIDEAERHAELYGSYSPRQQMLLSVVKQTNSQLPDKEYIRNEYIRDVLHAVNASVVEINWLQRTGHIYLG